MRNANHSTQNSRNFGSKVEWQESFRENFFENLGIPREVVLFLGNFGKFWEMLFLSLLEVAENSNGTFWLNGRREEFVFFDYEVFATQFCVMSAISPGAPNENIVQNHLNIALLNVF